MDDYAKYKDMGYTHLGDALQKLLPSFKEAAGPAGSNATKVRDQKIVVPCHIKVSSRLYRRKYVLTLTGLTNFRRKEMLPC